MAFNGLDIGEKKPRRDSVVEKKDRGLRLCVRRWRTVVDIVA